MDIETFIQGHGEMMLQLVEETTEEIESNMTLSIEQDWIRKSIEKFHETEYKEMKVM